MRLLVCGRSDLNEEYLCELIDVGRHGHAGTVSPIVRVLAVLRYPIQHAIYYPDIASEVPPVPGGCVCRLPYLREAGPHAALAAGGKSLDSIWRASAAAAQREYLTRCESAAEREIIARHMAGEYAQRRSLRTYKEWEIDAHMRAWEKVRHD